MSEPIKGTVIYLGPALKQFGLYYSKIFKDEVADPNVYTAIEKCPPVRNMIVPIDKIADVLKQLNFDIAHNMRGTTGQYVISYNAIRNWLAQAKQPTPPRVKRRTKQYA